MTTQFSKLQLRRGVAADLPIDPALDVGELGFTTDSGRLFIGQTPSIGQPNFERSEFPFQNIEVVTENTPGMAVWGDKQQGYIQSELIFTASFTTMQVNGANYYVDLPTGSGYAACATIHYFIFNSLNEPIRIGRLNVLWGASMVGAPLFNDLNPLYTGSLTDIQWQAAKIGSLPNTHVVLQYINNVVTGSVYLWFSIDRPSIL